MLADPQMGVLGPLIVELREDIDVAAIVGDRVRGFEPAEGDAQQLGSFRQFIVLVVLGDPPAYGLPITFATIGARCYGITPQGSSALWHTVVKAIHKIGPRLKASGFGIYQSLVIDGGEQEKDPDTKQPVTLGTIRLVATTQAVA